MIKDYYQILALRREASLHDINSQYKRLVLRWHPRFAKEQQQTAHHHFSQISQAYEVLSDSVKRAFYDRYGYLKLKEGLFEQGELKGGYRFANNPDEIFQKFFLHNNSLAQSVDTEILEQGCLFGSAFGGLKYKQQGSLQDLVVEVTCSLNELYVGVAKAVFFQRYVLNADGRTTSLQKQRKIVQIKPGFDSNSQIVFKGEGHQSISRKSSDLVFKIRQQINMQFKRKGDDLFTTLYIPLADALDSKSVQLTTLDNRILRVSIDEIISPKTVRQVEGQGMPKVNGQKGSLFICFSITFPTTMDEQKRNQLRELLC